MVQKILELLERFVAAQEKMAEANMRVARDVEQIGPLERKDSVESQPAVQAVKATFPEAEFVEVCEAATAPEQQKSGPVNRTGSWSPFAADIQGRYGKDKVDIMDALLAERGLPVKGTGAEKHQTLLDCALKAYEPLDSQHLTMTEAEAPENAANEVAEDAAPPAEVTVDDVRQLAQKAMAAKMAAPDIQVIFEKHGGYKRLPEIPAEKLARVFAALTKAMDKQGV